jgi:hypothetical protein
MLRKNTAAPSPQRSESELAIVRQRAAYPKGFQSIHPFSLQKDPTKTYEYVEADDLITSEGPVKPTKRKTSTFIERPLYGTRHLRAMMGYHADNGVYEEGGMVWSNKYHHFTQNQISGSVPGNGTASAFSLGNVTESTSLSSIFDQYMIERITLVVTPVQNFSQLPAIGGGLNGTLSPMLESPDYDDNAAPTVIATLESKNQCRIHFPGDGTFVRSFVPRVALAAYSGSFTSYASSEPIWIDVVSPNVAHYGWKTWVTASQATQTVFSQWSILTTYHCKFKLSQ